MQVLNFCSLFISIWFGLVSILRGWLQLPFPSLHWISMSSPSLSFSIHFSVQFPKSKLGNKLPSLRLPVPALWPRARGETRMPTFLFLFSFPMPLPNSNSNSLQFILRPPYSVSTIPRKSRSPRSHLLDLNPNPIQNPTRVPVQFHPLSSRKGPDQPPQGELCAPRQSSPWIRLQ